MLNFPLVNVILPSMHGTKLGFMRDILSEAKMFLLQNTPKPQNPFFFHQLLNSKCVSCVFRCSNACFLLNPKEYHFRTIVSINHYLWNIDSLLISSKNLVSTVPCDVGDLRIIIKRGQNVIFFACGHRKSKNQQSTVRWSTLVIDAKPMKYFASHQT